MRHKQTDFQNEKTMADVLDWSRQTNQPRDALYELEKIAPRMGLLNAEMSLIPADLAHFEKVVAVTSYGSVSKAKNLNTARKRGNARVRALLQRFWQENSGIKADPKVRESYDAIIEAMTAREGFCDRGADLTTQSHMPFLLLRARARQPLADLGQDEIDRLWREATPDGRKVIRKALSRIEQLRRGHNMWPEIAALLPSGPLAVPAAPDRARRIVWDSLPVAFRKDADHILQKTLRTDEDLEAWARAQRAAGVSLVEIDKAISAQRAKGTRRPKNKVGAINAYRQSLTWLIRELSDEQQADLKSVSELFTDEIIETACRAQITRSKTSATLKSPEQSSTLWSRFTNLTTIARHGLKDEEALAAVNVVRLFQKDAVHAPKSMTREIEEVMDRMRRSPELAARFVNAPQRLHDIATERLNAATTRFAKDEAIRLFAVAAAWAIQVSRPLRPGNLFMTRMIGTDEWPRHLTWRGNAETAEIRFSAIETKTSQHV